MPNLISDTITNLTHYEEDGELKIKEINYKIYWFTSKKHCGEARPIKQVDGKIAWVCTHYS